MAPTVSYLLNSFIIIKIEQSFNFAIGFMHRSCWVIDGDVIFQYEAGRYATVLIL